MISLLIFGRETSEIYNRIQFFRDVAGYYEDKYIVQMGGPGKIVEGDGMFLIGKRKCGVGRMHTKEHVYVCLERYSRKIRRIVVKDKSASSLSVFQKYILPQTEMCTDPGTENTFFGNLDSIIRLHQIPGPIHIDAIHPDRNTQSVERSHCGIKMRLRLGRGLHRHNLQAVMDFEDFVYNRTDGKPATIFKKLGDAATIYVTTVDYETTRHSNISVLLNEDNIDKIEGIHLSQVKTICSNSVFEKAKRYEVTSSTIISTQISAIRNCIDGQYRAARIHEQRIWWSDNDSIYPVAFNIENIKVFCTCKHNQKKDRKVGKYCSHIIGQIRRTHFFQKVL